MHAVSALENRLRARLADVEERMQQACDRVGRPHSEVTLVAVTKTVSAEVAALLPTLGIVHLGENRPQELWKKSAELPPGVHWHLIGHLQRNKIDRTLPLVHWIHSVDSVRLLASLEEAAVGRESPLPFLLEVNASREASKGGFAAESLPGIVAAAERAQAPATPGPDDDGRLRRRSRALPADLPRPARASRPPSKRTAPVHTLHQLSMGMSNDYAVAIEEGRDPVRIGTALFEGMSQAD